MTRGASLLRHSFGSVDRPWRRSLSRTQLRRVELHSSSSLDDEISHIAHDAGLTQDGVVASLQRAVAKWVEREAERRTTRNGNSAAPRTLLLAVSAALTAGMAIGLMWQPPEGIPQASAVTKPPSAAPPSAVEPAPSAVQPPEQVAEPTAVPTNHRPLDPRPPRSRPATASALQGGQLVIVTEPPGARVTVDGVGRGVTPLTLRGVSPGTRRVRVTKDGYTGAERVVTMAEDAGRTVRIPLERRE